MAGKNTEDFKNNGIGTPADLPLSSGSWSDDLKSASRFDCGEERSVALSSKERDEKALLCHDTEPLDELTEHYSTEPHSYGHYMCIPAVLSFEDFRRLGGEKLRQLGQAMGNSYREIRSVTSKRFQLSLNGPSHDNSTLQQEEYDQDGIDGDGIQEEHFESLEHVEEELQAGPDLPSAVEREDVSNSIRSGTLEQPLVDERFESAKEQMGIEYSREGPQVTRSAEQSRGRTSDRSTAGSSRTRAVSSAEFGERSGLDEEVAGHERIRANSEPRPRCLNCNQNPTQEVSKIVLRRSLGIEKKCYYCHDGVAAEICLRTCRFIRKREWCQKRHESASIIAIVERS